MSTIEGLVNDTTLFEKISLKLNRLEVNNPYEQIIDEINECFKSVNINTTYIPIENMRLYFEQYIENNHNEFENIFTKIRGEDIFVLESNVYIPLKIEKQSMGTFKIDKILKNEKDINILKTKDNFDIIKNQLKQILYGPFNKKKIEGLIEIAYTDKLTSLNNKRMFDKDYNDLIDLALEKKNEFSFVYFDVNRFKSVNDHLGHLHGDDVLIELGQIVLNQLYRPADRAYRVGGEEFSILLPETSVDGAKQFAKRLYQKISEHEFNIGRVVRTTTNCLTHEYPYQPGHITVSIGVSSFPSTSFNPKRTYSHAEIALRTAKNIQRDKEEMLMDKNIGLEERNKGYHSLPLPIKIYKQEY